MNKKIVTLLIVLIAAVSIASVCAVELTEEKDFDGLFKMKVADGDNFTNMSDINSNKFSDIAGSNMAYKNANDTIIVFVYGNADVKSAINALTGGNIDFQYQHGVDLVKFDGNVAVFDSNITAQNQNLTSFAGVDDGEGNIAVIICGQDADLVKEYAETIKFD